MKGFIERYNQIITIFLAIVSISLALVIFYKLKTVNSSEPIYIEKAQEVEEDSDKVLIKVDIGGEVKNPGVYEFEEGKIVDDAIKKAGGFTQNSNKEFVNKSLNRADKLIDGQKIYVPANVADGADNMANYTDDNIEQKSGKVSINSGSLEELLSLSGIGETYANRIIEGRPYSSIEQIKEVKGIGESTFEKIKDNITL